MDTVGFVSWPWFDFMKEGNLSILLQGCHVDIDQVFQAGLQTSQLMVVSRKKGLGSDMLMDVFNDGLSKSHPVISCSSSSQFIKENERVLGRMRNSIVSLHHLYHEG